MKAKPKTKAKLIDLQVQEISFVDEPAVRHAKFIVAKRYDGEGAMENIEKRIAMQGYTGSAPGASTPAHIHEYYCYLDRETGEMSGYASSIADHSHRITPESYGRGETEESDGHLHTLMTIKEARALLTAGVNQQKHDIGKGQSLAALLNRLIDDRVTDDRSRSDIVAAMASAAGIEPKTVNQILDGTIQCPPLTRLTGFSRALDVAAKRLRDAAEADGCEYQAMEKVFAELTNLKALITTLKAAQPVTTITEPNGTEAVTLSPEDRAELDRIIAAHGAHTG